MSKPSTCSAWAICCDDDSNSYGICISAIGRRRSEAINKFMQFVEGSCWTSAHWRQWKRKGYRASRAKMVENLVQLPKKGQTP